MRIPLVGLILLATAATASAREVAYRGTWQTTNRKLDGTMTCVVTDLGYNKWRGHFYGVWYGREFSYKVNFTGPPDNLKGTAVIDGADYEWTGRMDKDRFTGKFWGNRYRGSFDLKEKVNRGSA